MIKYERKKRQVMLLALVIFVVIFAFWVKYRVRLTGEGGGDDLLWREVNKEIAAYSGSWNSVHRQLKNFWLEQGQSIQQMIASSTVSSSTATSTAK